MPKGVVCNFVRMTIEEDGPITLEIDQQMRGKPVVGLEDLTPDIPGNEVKGRCEADAQQAICTCSWLRLDHEASKRKPVGHV